MQDCEYITEHLISWHERRHKDKTKVRADCSELQNGGGAWGWGRKKDRPKFALNAKQTVMRLWQRRGRLVKNRAQSCSATAFVYNFTVYLTTLSVA
jgi:hypothetical protein